MAGAESGLWLKLLVNEVKPVIQVLTGSLHVATGRLAGMKC